ncbi:beta-ketoacyl-[acyl-carrier-protein] synthase family protein [Radicibacter daui]|uniref:beta-ketoacyl-[acyl-carrier-protein] synthase family protein n=1 Tax=Radicibacter daui TaxID=3064829 RepID=UPI004046B22C
MQEAALYLQALGIVSALGIGKDETVAALQGLRPSSMAARPGYLPEREVVVGEVPGTLEALPAGMDAHDTRTNRLLWAAARQIRPEIEAALGRYGAGRIGVVLGTSTSGIEEGTAAYAHYLQDGRLPDGFVYRRQELSGPAEFLRDALGVAGPAYTISTACSSSAKVLAAGRRLVRMGLCDAVLVGGVDGLCRFTVAGFDALSSVSATLCNPMSTNRDGINIGEGAALFLMGREEAPVALLGVGESSDAHHPSAPHPEGKGAIAAMRMALAEAGLTPDEISYLNLHGTATPLNDEMEARAVVEVLGHHVAASSTKPLTGHTLGAAGAIEAAILWLLLAVPGMSLPRHVWDGAADPALPELALVTGARLVPKGRIAMMSSSFAFGGSNAAVILARGAGAA